MPYRPKSLAAAALLGQHRCMYRDRTHAGRELSRHLDHLRDDDPVVLALPRGGVPVAAEVAKGLDAPLDVILVRKLGVPYRPELAWGAIGEDGTRVVNDDVLAAVNAPAHDLVAVESHERLVLNERIAMYRDVHPAVPLAGRSVVIIDDGLATGATMAAACRVARARGANTIVAAVPVAPRDWEHGLRGLADQAVCPQTPTGFRAVGAWYEDFRAISDEVALACLAEARSRVERSPELGLGDPPE